MLAPAVDKFEGPLPITRSDGSAAEIYRLGKGLVWAEGGPQGEFPYTVYISEDTSALASQIRVFRRALWGYLGGAGLVLLLLQMLVLRWSLRPLRQVVGELKRVHRGQLARMSTQHPRELEPLTESINAFIQSERENLDRQRNTLADLAHSLKTPLAVLRARLDNPTPEAELREEVATQLRRMNEMVSYQLARAHRAATPCSPRRSTSNRTPSRSCAAWRRCIPRARCCANSSSIRTRASTANRATCRNCSATCWRTRSSGRTRACLLTVRVGDTSPAGAMACCSPSTTTAPASRPNASRNCCSVACAATNACRATASAWRSCRTSCAAIAASWKVRRSEELGGARFEVKLPPGL
jgi:two-component system sensor histidine kinase PhoQ